MADIINLRIARKAKVRQKEQAEAALNRVKYGRTKSEKQAEKKDAERLKQTLDHAKREGNSD